MKKSGRLVYIITDCCQSNHGNISNWNSHEGKCLYFCRNL